MLEEFGWNFVRRSGNNYAIFEAPNGDLLNVPLVQGRRIKRPYLRKVCDALGLEDEFDPAH